MDAVQSGNPTRRVTLHALALILLGLPGLAQLQFVEVATARGLTAWHPAPGLTVGLAAADYDNDGDVDLFLPNREGAPNQLYRNDGAGQYTEIAGQVGLAATTNDRAALWFDYDGDRDLDLVVVNDCFETITCTELHTIHLYRQTSSGSFEDVTVGAGLGGTRLPNPDTHVGGLCAGDVNGDGWLDLYVCFWEGSGWLFMNDGQGAFNDQSLSSGLGLSRPFWQPLMHDFNGDGALDIYQAVDFGPNLLWMNNGTGTFLDAGQASGTDNAMNDMGVACGDWNNDGDQDLYVTNQWGPGEYNIFLVRRGSGQPRPTDPILFDEGARRLDVEQGYIGWGTTFLDANLDGWLDLSETSSSPNAIQFFLNRGGHQGFDTVGASIGLGEISRGGGLVSLDFDQDGDPDLLEAAFNPGPPRLFSNDRSQVSDGRTGLMIRPRATGRNHRAIGAVVTCRTGERIQTRVITAGTSMLSQEPAEALFGLPRGAVVDVEIRWPGGRVSQHPGIPAGITATVWKP